MYLQCHSFGVFYSGKIQCLCCVCVLYIYFKHFSWLVSGRERGWARATRSYRIIATTLPGCLLLLLFCCLFHAKFMTTNPTKPASQPTDWIYWDFCAAAFMCDCAARAKCGLPCCEFQHHDNELTLPIVEWIKSIRTSFSSSTLSSCWLFFRSLLPFHIDFNAVLSFSISFSFLVPHSMNGWMDGCGCGCAFNNNAHTKISRLIITAVSPNVVIDIVLWLKIEKLGLYKGIHTIIIAVTTINDVLSIFLFNVILGVIFSTGILLLFVCLSFFPFTLLLLLCSCHVHAFLLACSLACIRICTVIDFYSQWAQWAKTLINAYLSIFHVTFQNTIFDGVQMYIYLLHVCAHM